MTYYCTSCGAFVKEDDIEVWQEKIPRYDDDPRKCNHEYCPYCHDEYALEEACVCDICGELIKPSEKYCEDCEEELSRAFSGAIESIRHLARHKGYKQMKEHFIEWLEWHNWFD